MVCAPGQPAREVRLSGHADIFPTVLDALGVDLDPHTWSNGRSLLGPEPAAPWTAVTGVGFPSKADRLALIRPDRKLWLLRGDAFDQLRVERALDADEREVPAKTLPGVETDVRMLGRELRRFLRQDDAVARTEPEVQVRVDARLGDWIRLVGYDLDRKTLRKGGDLRLKLVYECLRPVPKHWRLFLHSEAKSPSRFDNLDHVAGDGRLPLEKWRPGEFVADWVVAPLAKDVQAGTVLRLYTGLWAPGRVRPAIQVGPGFPVERGRLRLLEVRVQ